jgi:tyrosine-protein kinase Etk/Wzc
VETNSNTDILPGPGDQHPGFLDLAVIAAKYWKWLLAVPFGVAVLALITTLLMRDVFTAKAVILPPQQQSAAATAALLGQIGLIGGGMGQQLGLKQPGDLYVGMLKSRTIADQVITQFKLAQQYGTETMVDARRELAGRSVFTVGKDGLVSIEYDDHDPKRAAEVVNAYVDHLDRLTQTIAIGEAGQRRLHFERHLKAAKDALAEAEVALKKTQEQTGLIRVEEQAKALIEAVATLRAQVAAKEVELRSMRNTFATESNPEYLRLEQQLRGLKGELRKLESSQPTATGDIFVPTGKVPEAGLEYVRKMRDVKYAEAMLEALAKQHELARLEEAKDNGVVQIVDRAVAPDRKTRPRRGLIVVVTALFAATFMFFWAVLREWLSNARGDTRAKLHQVRLFLPFRKTP